MNSLINKFRTFIKSLIFHIHAGLPKATQAEINYRFTICMNCDSYNKEAAECNECGCNINNKKIFMNKLAWADQYCPLNKWQPINR